MADESRRCRWCGNWLCQKTRSRLARLEAIEAAMKEADGWSSGFRFPEFSMLGRLHNLIRKGMKDNAI